MPERVALRDDALSSLGADTPDGHPQTLRVDSQGSAWVRLDRSYSDVNELSNDADVASTGVKLTYNPPAGSTAVVVGASKFDTSGNTAVVDLELNDGANDITLERWAAGTNEFRALAVTLEDGHVLRFRVSTAGAANDTADLAIFAKEPR